MKAADTVLGAGRQRPVVLTDDACLLADCRSAGSARVPRAHRAGVLRRSGVGWGGRVARVRADRCRGGVRAGRDGLLVPGVCRDDRRVVTRVAARAGGVVVFLAGVDNGHHARVGRERAGVESWSGEYVGSVAVTMTFEPHCPADGPVGWQLSPDLHVDRGSPSAPVDVTVPSQTFARISHRSASRSVGTCTCASRWTIGCVPSNAVTEMSTSRALGPARSVNAAGRRASLLGTRYSLSQSLAHPSPSCWLISSRIRSKSFAPRPSDATISSRPAAAFDDVVVQPTTQAPVTAANIATAVTRSDPGRGASPRIYRFHLASESRPSVRLESVPCIRSYSADSGRRAGGRPGIARQSQPFCPRASRGVRQALASTSGAS